MDGERVGRGGGGRGMGRLVSFVGRKGGNEEGWG